jgi:amidase
MLIRLSMDIIAALGPWLDEVQPQFGADIMPRFGGIRGHAADAGSANSLRGKLRERLAFFFATHPGAAIAVPSAPSVALPRELGSAHIAAFYDAALAIGSIASLAGLPQVSIPILRAGELPIGLGLIAAQGSDHSLLAFASELALGHCARR